MKVDAHIHLFERGFQGPPASKAGVDDYERIRAASGIGDALVVGYEGEPFYAGNNDYILNLAETRSWIRPIQYLSSLRAPEADELSRARAAGFVGFSVYLDEPGASLDAWSAHALEKFGAPGSIVSVNASMTSLAAAGDAIAAMSSSTVLISHLGLPGEAPRERAAVRERMRPLLSLVPHEHVSVKLSAFYAVDPVFPYRGAEVYVRELLQSFGPARLVWGTDFSPVLEFGTEEQIASIPRWLREVVPSDELDAILRLNLARALEHAEARTDPNAE